MVDGSVNAAPSDQCGVGGIDNRIYRKFRYIYLKYFHVRRLAPAVNHGVPLHVAIVDPEGPFSLPAKRVAMS